MTNATGVAQQQNQETVEKLNKIPTQNQTSEASKGHQAWVKRKMLAQLYKLILPRNNIQALRLISLLKVHKVAKQTNQRYQILVMWVAWD